jgi:hypothetical protein
MASVLVIDDGELQDVRALLDELGTEFVHLEGTAIPEEIEDPRSLLVSTARRAVVLRYRADSAGRPRPPVRIAVCTGSSKTQRSILKRVGFDYLVRRPVHPAALRLLLLRALYHGKEKRHSTRFAFGGPVVFRSGFRRRKAILAEISAYGCRLLTRHHLPPGATISIQLPAEAAGGKTLELRGEVVRVEQGDREHAEQGQLSIGLRFDGLCETTKARLRELLVELYWGPTMLPDRASAKARRAEKPSAASKPDGGAARAEPARTDAPENPEPAEATGTGEGPTQDPLMGALKKTPRRVHPRMAFDREVIAMCPEATRVLVGCDLSKGGMRVEPHPKLAVGDRARLAIYADPTEDPFIVEAFVVRDDGEAGLALQFEWMDRHAETHLETLIGALPGIESLEESDSVPIVLGELVQESEDSPAS